MTSVSRTKGPIHLGLDVHKDSISVAILHSGHEAPEIERIFHDEVSVRRLVARLGDPRNLRACYEAGPTGYELHRLLSSLGVRCQVIAPSLGAPLRRLSAWFVADADADSCAPVVSYGHGWGSRPRASGLLLERNRGGFERRWSVTAPHL